MGSQDASHDVGPLRCAREPINVRRDQLDTKLFANGGELWPHFWNPSPDRAFGLRLNTLEAIPL
jgi:hypothetical protein